MADYKPKRFKNKDEKPAGSGASAAHFGSGKAAGKPGHAAPAGRNASSKAGVGGSRFASSGKKAGAQVSAPATAKRFAKPGRASAAGATQAATDALGRHGAASGSSKPAQSKPHRFRNAGSDAAGTKPGLGRHGSAASADKTRVTPLGSHGKGATKAAPALAGSHAKAAGAKSLTPVKPTHATSGSYHTGDAAKGKAGLLAKKGGNGGGKNELARKDGGKKKAGARDWISRALIIVGVGLMLAAAGIFIHAQIGYKQATDTYDDLAKYAKLKDADGDNVPNPDFDQLSSINKDVVGWIYIPGTTINYPVVQGTDNTHYLRTMFEGTYNASGTIFMDVDGTAPGMVDEQTTIYGHHMENGGMFNPIADTVDQSTFDNIKHVYYITKDHVYKLKPLLTHVVDGSYTDARTPNFTEDGTSLKSYLETMLADAEAKASDASDRAASAEQVLTLVTCKRDILQNGRAVMICTIEKTTDHS